MQVSKNVSWRWRPALSVLVALVYCTSLPAQASHNDIVLPEALYAVTSFSLPNVFPTVAEQAIDINFKVLKKTLSATPAVQAIMAADKHKKVASRKKFDSHKKIAYHKRVKPIIMQAQDQPILAPAKGWLDDPKNLHSSTLISAKETEKKIAPQAVPATTAQTTVVTGWLDDPKKLTAAPASAVSAPVNPQPVEASLPVKHMEEKRVSITQVVSQPKKAPEAYLSSSPKQDRMTAIQFEPKVVHSDNSIKVAAPPVKPSNVVAVAQQPKVPAVQKEEKPDSQVHLSRMQNEENPVQEKSIAAPVVPVKEMVLTNSDAGVSLQRNPALITMATPFVPITSASDQPASSSNSSAAAVAQPLLPLAIPIAPQAQTMPSAPVITSQPLPVIVTPSPQAATTTTPAPMPTPIILPSATPPATTPAAQPLATALPENTQPVTSQTTVPASTPTQPNSIAKIPTLSAAPQSVSNDYAPLPVSRVMENALSRNPAQLSEQTRKIVRALPPEKPPVDEADNPNPVVMDHARKNEMEEDIDVKKHEGVGIKITVERPKLNITRMLENAYNDLVEGDQQDAIDIYKQVLKEQPHNTLALFGLATTYHRAGQIELARPLYGKLLAIDPQNKEGLNNFLVLIADESPQAAITELEKLERTHPEFSPIPAQLAIIHEKLGEYRKAAEAMEGAIALSPANLKYRYDMAVILDKGGFRAEAIDFYQQLVDAYLRGEKIPANIQNIQERLTFIRSNKQGM